MSKFTEADYPLLTELLTVERAITLDCDSEVSYDLIQYGGNVEIQLGRSDGGDDFSYLNITSDYLDTVSGDPWEDPKLYQKAYSKRFDTSVLPDGEIQLTLKLLPGIYRLYADDPRSREVFESTLRSSWEHTRISEALTWEELLSEVENEEDWTLHCFGNAGEMYVIAVVVTKPGRHKEELEELGEAFLPQPLWIVRKGEKYTVHVVESSD